MRSRASWARWAVVPAAVLAAGGCFATRQDVQILQNNLASLRVQDQQADSVHRVQLDHVISQLAAVNDTLTLLTARTTRGLGDVRGDLYSISQQLIQIQQLTGQSQTNLQKLRAQLEEHAPSLAPAPTASAQPSTPVPGGRSSATAAGDTAHPAAAGPGPNELFQLALDQLRRGSTGAARDAFQQLLQQYPNADVAPDAQFYLAEADGEGGQMAAADSGYQLVVQRYPTSPRAPTALFKHATILEESGKTDAAKSAFQELLNKYPQSDEAVLAKDRLRELK